MKPAAFVRHVPKTLDEAVRILAEVAPQDGRVLAGGQSLVPIMAFRLAKPAHLVDINEVAGLDKVSSDGKTLELVSKVTGQGPDGNEFSFTSTDKLTLSADGKVLTVVRHSESPRGPQDSTMVFNK